MSSLGIESITLLRYLKLESNQRGMWPFPRGCFHLVTSSFIFNIISLLNLWEFHIMHPNCAHTSVPPYHLPSAVPPMNLKKQTKQADTQKEKQKNKNKNPPHSSIFFPPLQHLFIHPGGIGSQDMSHSVPFCPISFT